MYIYVFLKLIFVTSLSIFAAGLNSAEYYDPRSNEWHLVACMSTRRSSVGVGVVAGTYQSVCGCVCFEVCELFTHYIFCDILCCNSSSVNGSVTK